MSVFTTENDNEIIIECGCGCGEGVLLSVCKDDSEYYFYQMVLDARWNTERYGLLWKFKKLWAVLWNKDYLYSEAALTKDEFQKFKDWMNKF